MRLHRLTLSNVRGVTAREVVLLDGDVGVTVVEGPNESGKSTLADALDVLLNYKAGSSHRQVRSLQTEGVDAGPEIIAKISAGPYRLVYRKRYLRRPITELEVLGPRAERLSGDEAHERVDAILDETIDRGLWEALRLPQDANLEQAKVGGTAGLAAALEQRAGVSALGDRELALLEQARLEYRRYFTDAGNPRRDLMGLAEKRVADAEAALADIDTRIAKFESDVDRADRIEGELPRLRQHAADAKARAEELAAQRARVDALRDTLARCQADLDAADAQAAALTARLEQRRKLRHDLAEVTAQREGLEPQFEEVTGLLDRAEGHHRQAQDALAAAQQRQRDARTARQRAQDDLDHLRAVEELTRLRARLDAAHKARHRLSQAQARAQAHAIDDDVLASLRAAHSAADRTQAALDAASPEVTFTAHTTTTVTADQPTAPERDDTDGSDRAAGDATAVDAGEQRQWTVHGALTLGIGEIGEVTVRSGAGTDEAAAAHRQARQHRDDLLVQAGVADLTAAEDAHRTRRDALADAKDADRDLQQALDGQTLDSLDQRAAELASATHAYRHTRPDQPDLPADLDAAQRLLTQAQHAESDADDSLEGPQSEVEAARQALDAQQKDAIELQARASELDRRHTALTDELANARAELPDETLDGQAEAAQRARSDAETALTDARNQLTAADPETVTAQADNAADVATRAQRELAEEQQKLRDLRTRISALGGDGLHEQRHTHATDLEHARADLDSLQKRATAAQLLYHTLDRHRAQAFDRHAAPLREQITRFGRMLHGPDFDIELDEEDLRVARRHLDGLWLDATQLSVGAREQLALLGRLAAAVLLADQGGVLLFDDALGNTDHDRLEAAGAALRLAGQHCQVVILTCYPQRYRHVGSAHRITLA